MKPKEARSKVIDGILASRTDCKECKAVYEKYQKIFFKKIKGKFKQEHPEVARYEKAAAYLAKHSEDVYKRQYYWNKEHIFNSILYSLPVGALAAEAIVIFIYFLGHHRCV